MSQDKQRPAAPKSNLNPQTPPQGHKTAEIRHPLIEDFCHYLLGIRGRSELTVKEYRYDLILFFRYLIQAQGRHLPHLPFNQQPIDAVDLDWLSRLTLQDLYGFIGWLARDRKASAAARSRRVATLRSYFKYLHTKAHLLSENPAAELESPKILKRQPRYLELEESQSLLQAVSKTGLAAFNSRDYCILTLFLNCGMRLSELCELNCEDWREDRLRVMGKGGKERTLYLNRACLEALRSYWEVRPAVQHPALFISRQGNRLSRPAIQSLVKKYIQAAGLDPRQYSTHKLRHTAATLLYKYGQVDIRMLQHILGHVSVSTTEIYTHLDDEGLQAAAQKHPLAQWSDPKVIPSENPDLEP